MKNEEEKKMRAQTTKDENLYQIEKTIRLRMGAISFQVLRIFFSFYLFYFSILNCIIINALISTLKNQSLSYDIFAMIGFCVYI